MIEDWKNLSINMSFLLTGVFGWFHFGFLMIKDWKNLSINMSFLLNGVFLEQVHHTRTVSGQTHALVFLNNNNNNDDLF